MFVSPEFPKFAIAQFCPLLILISQCFLASFAIMVVLAKGKRVSVVQAACLYKMAGHVHLACGLGLLVSLLLLHPATGYVHDAVQNFAAIVVYGIYPYVVCRWIVDWGVAYRFRPDARPALTSFGVALTFAGGISMLLLAGWAISRAAHLPISAFVQASPLVC